ncbi:MAG: hypothetical protein DBX55_04650 [Verrucomicrobia bacterium]|nr:MAG: hypothetical protein DBX55_04650 [Verrucomicrobiota bacterium]
MRDAAERQARIKRAERAAKKTFSPATQSKIPEQFLERTNARHIRVARNTAAHNTGAHDAAARDTDDRAHPPISKTQVLRATSD